MAQPVGRRRASVCIQSGVISIGPDGNAQRRPFLLGVRGGQIVSLD